MGHSAILQLDTVYSRLKTDDSELKDFLWKKLRFRDRGYYHNPLYRQKKWDGFTNFFTKKAGQFLTGLLPEVVFALRHQGVKFEVIDKRNPIDFLRTEITEDFLWQRDHDNPVVLRDYQVDLTNQALKYKRGVIHAPTGCHAKGQKVLMADGVTKKVEDIDVGEELINDKGSPSRILSLCRGYGKLYRITPKKGQPFIVNEDHILTLSNPNNGQELIVDVSIKEWLDWSQYKKSRFRLFKCSCVKWVKKKLPIDPYMLGVLLGDGSITKTPNITTGDLRIAEYIYQESDKLGLGVTKQQYKNKTPTYYLVRLKGQPRVNKLTKELRDIGLWGKTSKDKFIPHIYKTASIKQRTSLLAGVLDSDGTLFKSKKIYQLTTKSLRLAEDVVFLARSLGMSANLHTFTQHNSIYLRVVIGNLTLRIPCRCNRKRHADPSPGRRRTSFNVEGVMYGEFYGFTLEGSGRYLLDDLTVTHNSGKTLSMISVLKCLPPKTFSILLVDTKELVYQNYDAIRQFGFNDVGMFFGEIKQPNYITVCLVNSAHKLKLLYPDIKCLIVDEIHDLMSSRCVKLYKELKNADIRIGFSATPFKFGGKDQCQKFKVKGHIGGILKTSTVDGGKLTTAALQERDILSSSECEFYIIDRPQRPYDIYQDAVTYGIAQNDYLNKIVVNLVKRIKGRTLLVVDRIEHGERLLKAIPGAFWMHGSQKKDIRKATIENLRHHQGNFVGIAIDKIVNKGINVFIHNLINCAGGKADHLIIQRMGRGLRTASDKEQLRYYDFYFKNNPYLQKHSEERIRILEQEGHQVKVVEDWDFC